MGGHRNLTKRIESEVPHVLVTHFDKLPNLTKRIESFYVYFATNVKYSI